MDRVSTGEPLLHFVSHPNCLSERIFPVQNLPQGTRIGLDGTLFGIDEMKNVIALTSAKGIELVLLDENLVDKIWQERPQPSKAPLRNHARYAGQDAGSKLASVRAILNKSKANAYVVHDLSEIAWLLNLRGNDIPFSPVFEAYLLVAATEATVFLDGDKLGNDVCTYLKDELKVQVRPYDEIWQALKDLNAPSKRVRRSSVFQRSKC